MGVTFKNCEICGKPVFAQDGEATEWVPGAILCDRTGKYYCEEHKKVACAARGLGGGTFEEPFCSCDSGDDIELETEDFESEEEEEIEEYDGECHYGEVCPIDEKCYMCKYYEAYEKDLTEDEDVTE